MKNVFYVKRVCIFMDMSIKHINIHDLYQISMNSQGKLREVKGKESYLKDYQISSSSSFRKFVSMFKNFFSHRITPAKNMAMKF